VKSVLPVKGGQGPCLGCSAIDDDDDDDEICIELQKYVIHTLANEYLVEIT
jgi:hypothetical protein